MDVDPVRRGGSMSNTADGIYAHKKFNRGTSETNSKDVLTRCEELPERKATQSSSNHSLHNSSFIATLNENGINIHNANTGQDLSNNICCSKCNVNFNSKALFVNHSCQVSTANIRNDKIVEDFCGDSVVYSRAFYSRSLSLPISDSHNSIADLSTTNFANSDALSPIPKNIYKPKFRAQYSLQEDNCAPIVSSTIESCAQHISATNLPTSNASLRQIASPLKNRLYCNTDLPSDSELSGRQSNISHLNNRNVRQVDVNITSKSNVQSPSPSIWKGIKSPSPEVLGQHITNLIVQNQAIVETQNPLWSLRSKRHFSSTHDDNVHRRRYSASDSSRIPKGLPNHRPKDGDVDFQREASPATVVPSLPRAHINIAGLNSPVGASKLNISSAIPPNSLLNTLGSAKEFSKYKNAFLNVAPSNNDDGSGETCDNLRFISDNQNSMIKYGSSSSNLLMETCDLTKSSRKSGQHSFGCPKCHVFFSSIEQLEIHLKLYCLPQTDSNYVQSGQVVALDLHKRRNSHAENENLLTEKHTDDRTPSRESAFSDPGFRLSKTDDVVQQRGLSASPRLHRLESFPPHSPPKKKRKIIDIEMGSHLTNKNGKHINLQNFGSKMLEDLVRPKSNSHHIYGGEVQICDGNAYKTLKIDSMKTDSPSLDLCLASQQLTAVSDKRISIPTSLVVTITKSGLNSGGTMVKIDSQKSNIKIPPMHNSSPVPHRVIVQPFSHSESSFTSVSLKHSSGEAQSRPVTAIAGLSSDLTKVSLSDPPFSSVITVASSPLANSPSFSNFPIINLKAPSKSYATCKSSSDAVPISKANYAHDNIPFVPGIPGPYSQASASLIHPSRQFITKTLQKSPHSDDPPETSILVSSNSQGEAKPENIHLSPRSESDNKLPHKAFLSENMCTSKLKLPEIRIQPPSSEEPNHKFDNSLAMSHQNQEEDSTDFLIPRKRPNTLMLKPQPFTLKSSLSLIGSTLVSPDTPRPKKSCVQLFLNGSAYTYLNLKVSTKTFFCCIYRPQPMYVVQSPNSKVSMYSNWQVRKTEDPFKLSPSESMSLYRSSFYCDRAYTLAKPKSVQLSLVPSSYCLKRKIKENSKMEEEEMDHQISDNTHEKNAVSSTFSKHENNEIIHSQIQDEKHDSFHESSPKNVKIKIFKGGFKTNEEYTYVRGRGRGRYVCETCGIRCKKPSMLKKHIRTHTDLRPFACKHCSFSFKTKGNLTKHLKSKAHFKRCTEMGIVPVPTSVNESHINQDAMNKQMRLDLTKDGPYLEGEDEDEDDEGDEEDEDIEDDEDEDEDEELMERTDQLDLNERVYPSNGSPANMSSCSFSNPTHKDGAPAADEDVLPMDLSVKRFSVIKSGPDGANSSAADIAQQTRPSFLPLAHTNLKSEKRSPISVNSCNLTPIKEQPSLEILSPLTESSLILKSIYNNTTYKVSSSIHPEKGTLNSNDIKETGSGDFMFQAYLKERHVLDSTRKRQYLYSTGQNEESLPENETKKASQGHPKQKDGTLEVNGSQMEINSLKAPRKLETSKQIKLGSDNIVVSVIHTSNNSIVLPSSFSIVKTFPENSKGGLSLTESDKSTLASQTIDNPELRISNSSSTIIYNPNIVSSSGSSSKNGSISSKSNGSFAQFPPHAASMNQMPTPPANMTVLNSCRVYSKTAFIAPSGVIPTNNRMESDDGKCKCSICNKEFAKPSQLSLHMNIHFIERPHRCESCSISFRTSGHLQKHKRSVTHFNKVNMNMTFGTPSTENPRPYKCRECKVAFRIHGHLAKHLRSKLHIMKLECVGKLPFGTYAEIERSGSSLNEIDTSNCKNSLESLQLMAAKLYEKEPAKLAAWHTQQDHQVHPGEQRVRTVSNSSNNSEDYPLLDEQDGTTLNALTPMRSSGEDSDEEYSPLSNSGLQQSNCMETGSTTDEQIKREPPPALHKTTLQTENLLSGSSEGLFACPQCSQKFIHYKQFEVHFYTLHELNGHEESANKKVGNHSPVVSASPPLSQGTLSFQVAHEINSEARKMDPL